MHDKFITTPHYVRIVPDIYTKEFLNMGHPLNIINDFIHRNLLYPCCSPQRIPSFICNDIYIEPIPSDYLTEILNSQLPEKYLTKDKKKWDQKVSDFLKYYNNYVDAVCSNQERWNRFRTLLENRSYNRSVHY